ncbi:MAG: hypothetical protein ACPLVI_02750 [Thermoplasmata archaeon]|jgi:hypothetical protein|nr:hypothetical protein [Thermoplasmatales archaeon]
MYPLFSLAGKGVRIRATEDITEKIENIVKEMLMDPEISVQMKGLEFRDLTLECRQGYLIAINYGYYAKAIYPEKFRDTVFIRDRYSPGNSAGTRLIYIGDLWQKNGKRFFSLSMDIEGRERIDVRMVKGRVYYRGSRVIIFGKLDESMSVRVAGQIGRTIFAYRWYG